MKNIKNKLIIIFLVLIIFVFSKIIQFNYLPDKYLYDTNYIFYLLNGNYVSYKSYNFVAKFYDFINIFNFNNIYTWSYFLGIIFNFFMIIYLIKRKDSYTLIEYLFIIVILVLQNIYVFNLSKEFIQFLIFLIIYLTILIKKIPSNYKIIIISICLLLVVITFRIYYLIIFLLFIFLYFLYKKFKIKGIYLVIISIICIFMGVILLKYINLNYYKEIVLARFNVNKYRINSSDAISIINNLINDDLNYFKFIINYLINFFRMLFPLELLIRNIKYLPYVIYQIFITFNIFKLTKNINKDNILIFILIISYLVTSIIFEPDFGSFLRHQSPLSLIYLEMIILNSRRLNEKS